MDTDKNQQQATSGEKETPVVNGFEKRVIGDTVLVRQGGAETIEGNLIQIRQGGVVNARAARMEMNAGGVVYAQTENADLSNATAGILFSKGQANLDQSAAQILACGGSVEADQSAVGVLVSKEVSLNNSAVVFLVASKVNGNVTPMFGSREAAAFGAVAGLVGGLVILFGKLFVKKR